MARLVLGATKVIVTQITTLYKPCRAEKHLTMHNTKGPLFSANRNLKWMLQCDATFSLPSFGVVICFYSAFTSKFNVFISVDYSCKVLHDFARCASAT